jgi:phage shock protein A
MGLFKSLFGLARAKDRDVANAIEEKNIIGFAQNDLEDIQKDLDKARDNIGHIKGRIKSITEEIADLDDQIKNNLSKAEQLIGTGKPGAEELARQMCAKADSLDAQKKVQERALESQKKLLEQQESVEKELEGAFEECHNEMELMKTEHEVTEGNDSLTKVDSSSAQSAVSKFRERRKKMTEKLYTSEALAEQTKERGKSLDQKADELLGNNKGSATFEKLKAKKATPN